MSDPNDSRPPLVPKPIVSVIALGLLGGMFYTVHLDATRADFDGGRATFLWALGIFVVLGVDIARLFRRGGGGDR